jgi:undecaprenyl diphosphate synthase
MYMDPSALEEIALSDSFYTDAELSLLRAGPVPSHVAVIMDGNRRWARARRLPSMMGHGRGADNLGRIVRAAAQLGIKVLTVYSFSTENWSRPREEVDALMRLFDVYLRRQKDAMVREGVKVDAIGDHTRLPLRVRETLEEVRRATAGGNKIELVLAINYGGRDDIRRALQAMMNDCTSGKLTQREVTEELVSHYLDTAKWQDPELLIRTSGEQRLSNFLLWQICYSEVYVTDVYWPDFDEKELLKAVMEYQKRVRRWGG